MMDLMQFIDLALDIVSIAALVSGMVFVLAGSIGVLRLPDFYTRMHAAGVTDTLGAELIMIGLILQAGWSALSLKLALIGVFIFLTSPTASHAVANAAYRAGLKPHLKRFAPGREDEAEPTETRP
ncbi:monovalent cation/H(+) antiporter subunit G [Marinicauda sp. Alg238-R41]|jgi:multicomponent Na+:H+ antiporter subunit G|uniref:monovalent cation/H(+) antiporter subunit G n=1 Tax=Marinicauda sp. Alg238-R41 TaxID=2993447 RepID=UPI0022E2608B|nr:monovalent cation/H(+) antiporter subunit G [Marinicauda sp. Alg238-R41]